MKRTEPIRNPAQVRALLSHYRKLGHHRNSLLIAVGVFTALRISDILSLTTDMVYDFNSRKIRNRITITEKKTGKSKTIALNKSIITALKLYFPHAAPGEPLFPNLKTGKAITRMQANRIVREAGNAAGISFNVSCHCLRKTFGYAAWKAGTSPVVIMNIYNHSSFAVTQRYLGVCQDDQDTAYLGITFDKTQEHVNPHRL